MKIKNLVGVISQAIGLVIAIPYALNGMTSALLYCGALTVSIALSVWSWLKPFNKTLV